MEPCTEPQMRPPGSKPTSSQSGRHKAVRPSFVALEPPSRARLFELARARLEQVRIPAPVRALRILARELPPFVPVGRDLFDARPAQALPWEALDATDALREAAGALAV